ncbi:LysM domain-containing protein [Variovorax sp. YR216]|uniref:LysM peptidoglycan-binding domain-containing protein n=1 Tax=Variovorax sp. YR216 TaxID=1882828 RepID=UPI00089BCC07|nr:LysM domain-containing protein [Variovorax sp. YR216]SEA17129.1 LysM domain-containing protein [Variovorax sp. YR216]
MATTIARSEGYESWRRGVDGADSRWDEYDLVIKQVVGEYNMHLGRSTPRYFQLDWRLVKAMLWVETGPGVKKWKTRPMQIGEFAADPGLSALFGRQEGGELILPSATYVSQSAVRSNPRENIKAGVGYLLMRMANFEFQTVLDQDSHVYEVTVGPGDSLDRIAKAKGTTVEVLKKHNPADHVLRAGQVLKYQKASFKKVVTGWKFIDPVQVAYYYNGGGDPLYRKKLAYAYDAIRKAGAQ